MADQEFSPIQFDVTAARKKYSDSTIANTLGDMAGFDVAAARRAGYNDAQIINTLATPIDSSKGDVGRGFSVGLGQTVPMLEGAIGATGAVAEKAFGAGGISTAVKNWGLKGYQEGMQKLAPYQRDNDNLTVAWDRAKNGDLGALVDWAQYGFGYGLGQIGETAVVALLGGAAGGAVTGGNPIGAAGGAAEGIVAKGAVKGAVKSWIEKAVAKEAAELAEKQGVKTVTEEITKQATKNVAKGIGSSVAFGAQNIGQEVGSIYADAVEQNGGKDLDGSQLARVWGSGLAAGGLDTFSDMLGLGALSGKVKIPGAGGKVARGATGLGIGAATEGATEGLQTAIERYGANKSLTSDEAVADYINSAGMGALIGGTVGGASGALRKPAAPSPAESLAKITAPDTSLDDAIAAADQMTRRTDELSAAIGEWKTQSEQALTSPDPEIAPQQFDIFTGEAKDAVPAAPQQQVESEPMAFANPAQRDMLLETPTAMVQAGDAYTAQSLAQRIGMESGGERSAYGARLALEMSRNMQGSMALLEQESAKLQANLDKLNAKLDSPKATLSEQDYLKQRAAIESQMRQVEAAKGISSQFNQYMTNSYAAEASGRSAEPTLTNNATVADNSGTVEQMVEKNLRLRQDASLADVDARVQASMEQQAQQSRENILNNVLNDETVQDHAAKFQAELARAGVQDTAVRPEEANRIARFKEVNQTFTQPDVIPSAPNEFDPYASTARQAMPAPAVEAAPAAEPRNKFENVAVDPQTLPDLATIPGTTTNELTQQSFAALKQMARLVGKRVEIFENASDKAHDGYWDPKKPNTVFLNRKTTMPHMAVLFHEVLHALKNQNPQGYAAIEAVLKTKAKNEQGKTYKDYYGGKAEDMRQEMIADLTGNFAMEPDFWTDVFAEVERQNGAGAKSIIARLTATVTRVVRELVSRLSRAQGYDTAQWVENLQEVRAAVTSAMAQYVAQQRTNTETEVDAAPADVSKKDAEMSTSERRVEETAESEQVDDAMASPGRRSFDLSIPKDGSAIRDVKVGDTTISLNVKDEYANPEGIVDIASIRTPASKRGNGSARKAMTMLVEQADNEGVTLRLDASPLDAKTNASELRRFYASLGFKDSGVTNNSARDPEMTRKPSVLASPKRKYTAEQERVLGVGFSKGDTRSVTQKAKDTYNDVKTTKGMRMVMALADKYAPIKGVDEKAYALARMSAAAGVNGVEAILKYGKLHLTDGVQDVNLQGNKGFTKVLADLKGEHQDFFKWVAGHRAEYLKLVDKENRLSDADIIGLKSLADGDMADGRSRRPVYEKALAEMTAINNSVIDIAVQSGEITRELAAQFKKTPFVPFYRVLDDEARMPSPGKALTSQEAFIRLKGGYSPINDDGLANMLQNWTKILDASARNRAALATFDAIENTPGLQDVAERGNSETTGAVKVKRDGKWVYYKVNDPYLLEAITASNYALPGFVKPLAKFKQILTYGITSVPGFKFVSNPIRDAIQSIAVAPQLDTNPFKNLRKGAEVVDWKSASKNMFDSALALAGMGDGVDSLVPQNQTYASMLASGGIMKMGSAVEGGRAEHAENMVRRAIGNDVVLEGQAGKKFLAQLEDVWNAYEELGDIAEQSNRIALYERMMEMKDANGKPKYTHAEASFAARDLMDFSLTGNGQVVRFFIAVVPFLNARIQGLYKLGRAASESPASRERFINTLTAVTLGTLALWWAFKDDEDYKRREDWDVDTYWWFKIGDTAYRIPKPFEVGLMATMAQRTIEYFSDEEMTTKRYAKEWRSAITSTLAVNPIPQAFKPLAEVYFNTSMFTGAPIETMGDQKLEKKDRFDQNTSELAKMVGSSDLVPLSPKQVDAVLNGYFGTVAQYGNAMINWGTGKVTDMPARADAPLRKLTGNYVDDLEENRSRYTSVLYENSQELGRAYASYKAALEVAKNSERAAEILAENPDLVRRHKTLAAAERRISEVNRQIKMIQQDSQMDGATKREKINALMGKKSQIAENVAKQLQLR